MTYQAFHNHGEHPQAEGITNPPVEELLDKGNRFVIALAASIRARKITTYYSRITSKEPHYVSGEEDVVGPLVETSPDEKAVSIALREINAGSVVITTGQPDVPQDSNDKLEAKQ